MSEPSVCFFFIAFSFDTINLKRIRSQDTSLELNLLSLSTRWDVHAMGRGILAKKHHFASMEMFDALVLGVNSHFAYILVL